jgi:putative ABC transport system permease protein
MNVLASARIAVRALRVNKLRSALTMLGIVIGVGAVITMVAVGAGAQARVAEQIQSLGSNLIIIWPGTVNLSGVRLGAGAQATLSEDDSSRWWRRRFAATLRSCTPISTGPPPSWV